MRLTLASMVLAGLLAGCGPSAFRHAPQGTVPAGAQYLVRISVNGEGPLDLYCSLSPVVIDTEPPYHLVDCEPRWVTLAAGDRIDLLVTHLASGLEEVFEGLTPDGFLLRTQTAVTSKAGGHHFPEWDGQKVLFKGLDILETELPGT